MGRSRSKRQTSPAVAGRELETEKQRDLQERQVLQIGPETCHILGLTAKILGSCSFEEGPGKTVTDISDCHLLGSLITMVPWVIIQTKNPENCTSKEEFGNVPEYPSSCPKTISRIRRKNWISRCEF